MNLYDFFLPERLFNNQHWNTEKASSREVFPTKVFNKGSLLSGKNKYKNVINKHKIRLLLLKLLSHSYSKMLSWYLLSKLDLDFKAQQDFFLFLISCPIVFDIFNKLSNRVAICLCWSILHLCQYIVTSGGRMIWIKD